MSFRSPAARLEGIVSGKVLFGGADYQSPTTGPAIDARYLWQTTEGQVIIVRNAGPFNALIPTFETRVDGKYRVAEFGQVRELAAGRRQCSKPRSAHRDVQDQVGGRRKASPLAGSASIKASPAGAAHCPRVAPHRR